MRPKLLDLFCCAGGASAGYVAAGFDVFGIDNEPRSNYPYAFRQDDAPAALLNLLRGKRLQFRYPGGERVWLGLEDFAAVHGSPPCQLYTISGHSQRAAGVIYPNLLPPTRYLLKKTGLPWVIENVPGSPMRADYKLCGCQFGLGVDHDGMWLGLRRERWFETSWQGFTMMPTHDHSSAYITVVGHGTPSWSREALGFNPTMVEKREAMGITWTDRGELSEAIPPAYTEFIGLQLIEHLRAAA